MRRVVPGIISTATRMLFNSYEFLLVFLPVTVTVFFLTAWLNRG